jgi:hypothetical protein
MLEGAVTNSGIARARSRVPELQFAVQVRYSCWIVLLLLFVLGCFLECPLACARLWLRCRRRVGHGDKIAAFDWNNESFVAARFVDSGWFANFTQPTDIFSVPSMWSASRKLPHFFLNCCQIAASLSEPPKVPKCSNLPDCRRITVSQPELTQIPDWGRIGDKPTGAMKMR